MAPVPRLSVAQIVRHFAAVFGELLHDLARSQTFIAAESCTSPG
jgi:hypothetical protein